MKTNDRPAEQNDVAVTARWMIVDDNVDNLVLMEDIVPQFSDRPVEFFDSPQRALAKFEESPAAFEFVITDLEMPGLSGIDLCQRVHALVPEAKVLLTTGSALITEEEAAQSGFCGLLRKPFSFAALRQVLRAAGFPDMQQAA